MSPLASFIQHGLGSPSHSNQTRKRNKNTNWKKKSHCLQMAWYQTEKILHITKKLTSKLSEATGYRIYTQKSVACLCINNELSERESKKIITFKTGSKRVNYSGVNLSEVAQSCLTLCDPVDCSPPGSSVHGILQARILEWVVMLFFRWSSWPRNRTQVSHNASRIFIIWATRQAPFP